MRQVYCVKIGEAPAMEITAADTATMKDVVSWLREAVDSLSGDTKNCVKCGGTCFKHGDYTCQTCGEKAGLRLVKG
jgi:hypothetical protein